MFRRTAIAVFITTLLCVGSTTPAQAQLGWTFVGVGEIDTDDVYLVLGGVSVSPRRTGWSPVAGVTAYWLQYPVSTVTDATRSVTSITPSLGISNNFGPGAFQVSVGYSFQNAEDDVTVAPAFAPGGGSGVVNTAQVDYWGSGSWSAQAIGSYSYGSESFWGRGRAAKRLFSVGENGSISLGGEVALLRAADYDATKVGGVVAFNPGPGTLINATVGRKLGAGNASDATYFGIEFVLYPH